MTSAFSHTITFESIRSQMIDRERAASWIGASLLRKEDARHLHGHGMFIADINMPGTQEIAFVRSQRAHANVRHLTKLPESAGRLFTLADIGPINLLEAGPELAAHRHSPYPPLADRRVRYVGQTIAACMMPTRAQAEDLVDQVYVELEELPAVVDVVAAMRPDSPRVFDEWPNNAYISTRVAEGNPESLASAPIRLRRQLRLNRQATVSLEGRGVLAYWDHRLDELVSTSRPRAAKSSALRFRRCCGDSVSMTSSVGRTCASSRWPPIAIPSDRLTTACTCSAGLPSGPCATSPTSETTSTCSCTGIFR